MRYNTIPISKGFEIISGGTPKRAVESYWNGNIPWISIKDFNDEYRYLFNTEDYITNEGLKNSSTNILDKNDIIISARGTVGKINMIRKPMAFNQSCYGLRAREGIEAKYGYFAIKNSIRELQSHAYGSVFSTITKVTFDNIEIPKPKLSEQKIIGNILSSFDDKIENNNAIIANLEEQVQAIYKSWFVDFEPFLEEEFVDSELGKTPKSWKVVKLGDVSKEIVTGKTPSTKVPENYGDKMPFVTIPDMHDRVYVTKTERSLSDKGFKTQEKKIVPKNSIAVSCIATVGLVTLIAEDSITNQQINTVKPKEKISLYYLYSYLKTQSDFLNAIGSSGSTTKNVNKTTFSNLKLLLPSVEVLEKYHKLCEPIFDYILLIQKQNEKLIRTRDTLLPKLMSGEIRVEEAVESK